MINPFIVRDIDSYEEAGLLYNLTKKDLFLLEKITAWGSPENAELGGEANLRREFQSIINQGFCLEWIFNYKVMGVEYLNECRYKEDINVQLETNSYQFILTEPLNQKREDRNIIGGLRFNGKNGKVEIRKDFKHPKNNLTGRLLDIQSINRSKIYLPHLLIIEMVKTYVELDKKV